MSDQRHLSVPGLPAFTLEDLLTALVLSAIGVLFIVLGPQNQWFDTDVVPDQVAQPVLITCGFIGTLYAPRVAISTTSFLIGLGVDVLAGGHDFALWLVFQLVFALVGHASPRVSTVVFTLAGVSTIVAGVASFASGFDLSTSFQFSVLAVIILFLPALWASSVREHRNTAAAEHERAEAERARADAQEQAARLAAENAAVSAWLAEQKVRTAAAEDLHDLVAGHISAIALHSQAALAAHDERIRTEVLTTVHAAADRALSEMRRMIDVLRSDVEADPPVAASAAEAIALARSLGVTVTGAEALTALPDRQEAALRPVIAELISNVVKHASAPELTITVTEAGAIAASNPVALSPTAGATDRAGHGLDNIAHRLERLGGGAAFTRTTDTFTATLTLPGGRTAAPESHVAPEPPRPKGPPQ